jgi:hypothetical protein
MDIATTRNMANKPVGVRDKDAYAEEPCNPKGLRTVLKGDGRGRLRPSTHHNKAATTDLIPPAAAVRFLHVPMRPCLQHACALIGGEKAKGVGGGLERPTTAAISSNRVAIPESAAREM